MDSRLPAIHFTMHPSGVWTSDGERETFVGPCNTRVVTSAAGPDVAALSYLFFHTVSITRPIVPTLAPESSEEEDPEEGSTPPLSPQLMPCDEDIPESSTARAAQTPPLMAMPLTAVPFLAAPEPVQSPEREQPYYISDESEDMEIEDAGPDAMDEDEDEGHDEEMDGYGFDEFPAMVDFGDGAEWEIDDVGDFALDSDDEDLPLDSDSDASSCLTSDYTPGGW